ncbi:MAG: hypothetical protein QM752_05330 [Gammaproteobacteria bacterium]
MLEKKLTWREFQEVVQFDNDKEWLYRGHASSSWLLETTLRRFTFEDQILGRRYHQILDIVLSDPRVRKYPIFKDFQFPKESPFKIGLLCGDEW